MSAEGKVAFHVTSLLRDSAKRIWPGLKTGLNEDEEWHSPIEMPVLPSRRSKNLKSDPAPHSAPVSNQQTAYRISALLLFKFNFLLINTQ